MDKILQKLREQLASLNDEMKVIQNRADAEERDLTADEKVKMDQYMAAFDETSEDIDRREKLARQEAILSAGTGRQSASATPAAAPSPRIEVVGNSNVRNSGGWGFRNLGDFAQSVVRAHPAMGGRMDERIMNAPTAVGTGGTDADGGYAIPPDFREQIALMISGEDTLVSRTDQYNTFSNSIEVPKDDTTPWQTTGGVQVNWTAEANQITESKPLLGNKTVALHKLAALVPVSSELLADAPLMDTFLTRKAPQKIGHAVNFAIVQGPGTTQPEGFLNSAAKVAVAKEAAQVADTIVYENIVKMYSRMYSPYRANAVWIANSDTLPQLLSMAFRDGAANGGVPIFTPGNGFPNMAGAPDGTLLGKPIIFTEAANTVGDEGDISFVALDQYMTVEKSQGIEAATSIHLYFNYDVMSFRFLLRFGGETWLDAPISARDAGSPTLSSVVTLAARA